MGVVSKLPAGVPAGSFGFIEAFAGLGPRPSEGVPEVMMIKLGSR